MIDAVIALADPERRDKTADGGAELPVFQHTTLVAAYPRATVLDGGPGTYRSRMSTQPCPGAIDVQRLVCRGGRLASHHAEVRRASERLCEPLATEDYGSLQPRQHVPERGSLHLVYESKRSNEALHLTVRYAARR